MLGLKQQLITPWSDVIGQLYNIALRYEALIAEINPLVVLPNGGLLAVDAVLEVDDSALSRIRFPLPDRVDRIENPLERRGREIGSPMWTWRATSASSRRAPAWAWRLWTSSARR